MNKRYPIAKDGDRITPLMKGYKLACCDCGLTHTLDFEVVQKIRDNPDGTWSGRKPRNADSLRVVLYPSRDNRATGQLRRHRQHPMSNTRSITER